MSRSGLGVDVVGLRVLWPLVAGTRTCTVLVDSGVSRSCTSLEVPDGDRISMAKLAAQRFASQVLGWEGGVAWQGMARNAGTGDISELWIARDERLAGEVTPS